MRPSFVLALILATTLCTQIQAQDAKKRQQDRSRRPAFRQLFTLPGVQLNEAQQEAIQELRERYEPQLIANQKALNDVYTPEQRRARQTALRAAREAGKSFQEAQEATKAAISLTDDQKQQIAAAQKERLALQAKIRSEFQALLTPQQRAAERRPGNRNAANRATVRPTYPDLKYGPAARNVMDVWLAKSDQPTPVLVSIHGGGFRGGNKSVSASLLSECLASGISVVAITYRLSDTAIAPAQFHDSARAIQFLRHKAAAWNLDAKRIAACGGSAGAGISLWLGFHDDLADADNADPVLRQSSRLTCMVVYNGQTSYDPRFIRELFPDTDTYKHPALALLFDADLEQLDDLPQEKYRLFEEVSVIPHLTKDDVPAALLYASKMDTPITNQGIGIHHPKFGKVLKEKMDVLGLECQVHSGLPRDDWNRLTLEFVKKHLGVE